MHRLWCVRAGLPGDCHLPRRQRSGTMAELHSAELRTLREVEVTFDKNRSQKSEARSQNRDKIFWLLASFVRGSMAETNIESLLDEQRVFPPSAEFAKAAHITSLEAYDALCKRAAEDPEGYWGEIASQLHWFRP